MQPVPSIEDAAPGKLRKDSDYNIGNFSEDLQTHILLNIKMCLPKKSMNEEETKI